LSVLPLTLMKVISIAVLSLLLSVSTVAQVEEPKPQISKEPLTPDQIAIYRAVLKQYLGPDQTPLNLANRTDPIELRDQDSHAECLKGITLEKPPSPPVIHMLDASLAESPVVLVDPNQQRKKVQENDPGNLAREGVSGRSPTQKEMEEAVNKAFSTGLFTLSEILFDKDHRHAVVSYSFVCGRLCGNGTTLVLTKTDQGWRVNKETCGGWIS